MDMFNTRMLGVWFALCAVLPVAAAEDYDCLIEPDKVVLLSLAVEGVLAEVNVDRGDTVQAGQVIAGLESSVEQAAVAQTRARAEQGSEVSLRKAELALARRKAARIENLFKQKNASGQERDEARANVDIAVARLGQAHEAKRLAELEVMRAEAVLARRSLRSPFAGVVVERYHVAGEYVENEPVVKIARIDPLRVEAILPAERFGTVAPGQAAGLILLLDGREVVHEVRIERVDPVLDAASGTFAVRLQLPNSDAAIPSGLECRMRISH
ncbi:MAG TPA: efflux RND transporter periplasmic adaptor subunit [Gammaproteobacteria bacterium]|nr:efflux RND transporter periplasmic adaptor subunit [Gammaproteobacteria bacterium]